MALAILNKRGLSETQVQVQALIDAALADLPQGGGVEFATAQEVSAGTVTDKAISPKALADSETYTILQIESITKQNVENAFVSMFGRASRVGDIFLVYDNAEGGTWLVACYGLGAYLLYANTSDL